MENKIKNLLKQNDSIYNSLIAKNILFNRLSLENLNEEEQLKVLNDENSQLKEIAKNNKPPPQVKEVKQPIIEQKITETKTQKIQKDDEEENYEEPLKNFTTITNMEDIKRSFFNKEYDLFEELIKNQKLNYFIANYRYSSDKDGSPEYIATNLLKGFVRNLDDYRKYLMVCFRCLSIENKNYDYPSLWILNSNDKLNEIIGDLYDDFEFIEINSESERNEFLLNFRKSNFDIESNLLDEAYVH